MEQGELVSTSLAESAIHPLPLVSVVVPVYNVAEWVEECLESISAQTWQRLEVIVVDDGSTDNSGLIARSFAQSDVRFIVVFQDNQGLSAARNVGIDRAKGKYLLFVDGDDWICPTMVERLVTRAEKDDALITMCDYWRNLPGEESTPSSFGNHLDSNMEEHEYWLGACSMSPSVYCVVWNKLWRREVFSELRFEDGALYEDTIASLGLYRGNCPISIVDERLYYWRIRKGSITDVKVPGCYLRACDAIIKRDSYFRQMGWVDVRIQNLRLLTAWLTETHSQLPELDEAGCVEYRRLRQEAIGLLVCLLPAVLTRPSVAMRVIPYVVDERLRKLLSRIWYAVRVRG